MARQVVFVFGMGRSGSSALTGVLAKSGCALPQRLLGAGIGNPKGHYEPLEALKINKSLLDAYGSSWYDPTFRLQSEIVFDPSRRELYTQQIQDMLEAFAADLLVIKEPRLAALSDFWFDAAARAGRQVKIIIPVRHPNETAASLAARDSLSFELASTLWLKYNLLSERRSRDLPRVFVEYANFLDDWPNELARIGKILSLPLDRTHHAEINQFLEPDLRRQRYLGPPTEVCGRSWIGQVYAAFSGAARDEPLDQKVLDAIYGDFSACERVFRVSLEDFQSRNVRHTPIKQNRGAKGGRWTMVSRYARSLCLALGDAGKNATSDGVKPSD